MNKTIEQPSTTLSFEFKGKSFEIKYPNSGQMIDIAVLKAKLSDNQYTSLISQYSVEAPLAVKLVDAFSFLRVVCPSFIDNLATKSFYDLEVHESIEIVHAYDEKIFPWIESWTTYINDKIKSLKNQNEDRKVI